MPLRRQTRQTRADYIACMSCALVGRVEHAGCNHCVAKHFEDSAALGAQMGKLVISMEAYPDLKSDSAMVQAQKTYNEVEAQIAAARRFYNSALSDLNNSIEIFPGNLLAPLAKSRVMPFYEGDTTSREPVDAAKLLGWLRHMISGALKLDFGNKCFLSYQTFKYGRSATNVCLALLHMKEARRGFRPTKE